MLLNIQHMHKMSHQGEEIKKEKIFEKIICGNFTDLKIQSSIHPEAQIR